MFDSSFPAGYEMTGSYDFWLVCLSYAIATLASYTSLDLATRIKTSSGIARNVWIGGCAFTMGGGIWSMHFTAMLAFELPLEVTYNIWITLFSFFLAVLGSGIGFNLVNSGKGINSSNIIKGGGVMGCAVALMHYTGMAGMEMTGTMHYTPGLFFLSILIAVLAASTALFLVHNFGNKQGEAKFSLKIVTALIMGLAVFGMHYTGMAATVFTSAQIVDSSLVLTSDYRFLVFGVSGTTIFILGMTVLVATTQREIQKLVEAKNQLEKRIEELPKIPEQNPLPVFQVGRTGTILYANLAGENALSYWNCKMLGPIPSVFENMIHDIFEHQDSNSVKVEIGLDKYVFDAIYIKDQDRTNIYGTNITDLETSREALHIQRQNFYDMLDNLPICFHLKAPDNSVPYANKMYLERFGQLGNKNGYKHRSNGDTPSDKISPFKKFEENKKQNGIWNTNDGQTYLTVCTPFKDSEGEDLVMEMSMDITDQENAKIEALKAKEEAEKANQAKSEFLARMSHELRTPMNAILGFTQLLQMDKNNPLAGYQQKNMDRVTSAGHHLLALIDKVLDLSKIESGKIDISMAAQNIVPIIDDVISISLPLADEKGIILEYDSPEDKGCFAKVDSLRLKQVLLNLISNAIKYNKPKGRVTVSYKKQDNGNMRIGVEDTGLGIVKESQDKIFQPFERLDRVCEQIEGAGIGLTISKKFVELMGGTIGFESVEGVGSLFFVEIPPSDEEFASVAFAIPKLPRV